MIHTVKGFGIVNKAEIYVSLELSCFLYDPSDVGNLISGSSAFSKTSLNIWKFTAHTLLKPGLENSYIYIRYFQVVVVHLISCVQLFATPWTAACQVPLSFNISWCLLKFISTELVILSNHLILCCPLLLLSSILPSIKSFPVSWLFTSGGQSIALKLQHQSFQLIFRTDFL